MMRWLILTVLFVTSGAIRADEWPRYTWLDVVHYDVNIAWDGRTTAIRADVTIQFKVGSQSLPRFHLDLNNAMIVEQTLLDQQPVGVRHENNRLWIELDSPLPIRSEHELTVRYAGSPKDGLIIGRNAFGDMTAFSDHWPNRAHHWLPVVDHPADKATVRFSVTAPAAMQVVAVGKLEAEIDLPDGMRRTVWHMQHRIPTKVMVIGIAAFAVMHHEPIEGRPLQTWVFPRQASKGLDRFEKASRRSIEFFEAQIGAYPFDKLANIISRTRYGGMENAGAIFYMEMALERDQQALDGLIAHEIAHQWFGNHVTEKRWEDVWLSEGFATYWAARAMGYLYNLETERNIWRKHRKSVLAFSAGNPEMTIVSPVKAPSNAILSPLSYQKAAWFLRRLRDHIGDDHFSRTMRSFFIHHGGGNATTDDFRHTAEMIAGADLEQLFDYWLKTPNLPRILLKAELRDAELLLTAERDGPAMATGPALDLHIQWREAEGTFTTVALGSDQEANSMSIPLNGRTLQTLTPDPNVRQLAMIEVVGPNDL